MPRLTKAALWITVATSLLIVATLPVMSAQQTVGQLCFMVAMFGWLIASFCGLFGVALAKPKNKAINVFLFSLVGPLLTILLVLVLFSLPYLFMRGSR
jgi:hypothetical protein